MGQNNSIIISSFSALALSVNAQAAEATVTNDFLRRIISPN
jgi:hypothetical protein